MRRVLAVGLLEIGVDGAATLFLALALGGGDRLREAGLGGFRDLPLLQIVVLLRGLGGGGRAASILGVLGQVRVLRAGEAGRQGEQARDGGEAERIEAGHGGSPVFGLVLRALNGRPPRIVALQNCIRGRLKPRPDDAGRIRTRRFRTARPARPRRWTGGARPPAGPPRTRPGEGRPGVRSGPVCRSGRC